MANEIEKVLDKLDSSIDKFSIQAISALEEGADFLENTVGPKIVKVLKSFSSGLDSISEGASKVKEFLEPINTIADKVFDTLSTGWDKVSKFVTKAVDNNTAYFESLNNIVGLNGQLGQFGNTLRGLSSGTVGKADLSSFFGSTGTLFANAQAMEQTAGYARDLIAAYGSANAAAQKFQNIQLLSEESQEAMVGLVKQQAQAVEQSSAGQLKALKTQAQEAMDSLGASLLISVKPVIEFLSEVVQAFKDVSGVQALDDQTDALAKNLVLTEEQKKAAEELNEIERLRATGFTSSLDEVHETGTAYIEAKEQAQDETETVLEGEAAKQEAMEGTNQKAVKLAESLYKIVEVVQDVGMTFSDLFVTAGSGLLSMLSVIVKVVATVAQWLNNIHFLVPALGALLGVLAALKVAQIAYAAAVAVTKVAQGGPAAPLIAATIAAGVAAVAGTVFGIVGEVQSGFGTSSVTSNAYSGTRNETAQSQINVYLDGKKVNDSLATEQKLNTQVVLS